MQELPDLIVIRHGETQWNVAGRLQGRKDTPLTNNGVRQAKAVGVRLADTIASHQGLKFWSSPLPRALQTASILAGIWTVPFEKFTQAPLLMERSFGVWEGQTSDEIKRDLSDQYRAQQTDPWDYTMPEGESRNDLKQRMQTWLATLEKQTTHVVVTHSGCLRALRGIYTKASSEVMLAYSEPQTASFLLSSGRETMLEIPAGILWAMGCEGAGTTVRL